MEKPLPDKEVGGQYADLISSFVELALEVYISKKHEDKETNKHKWVDESL